MERCILPYKGMAPKIANGVFIAPTASVVGDVTIGTGSSIWFGATIRGDFQPISIGAFTNIQDNTTIHVMGDTPTELGNYVTVGHNCIIHCRSIGNNCLIGMGSIILGYSEIGDNCIIGAGTLLTQHKKIPNNCLIRAIREDELEALRESAMHYYDCAKNYDVEFRNLVE